MAARLTITINAENDAFVDNPEYEIASILRGLTNDIEENGLRERTYPLWDSNGNRCGNIEITLD